jgi:hypothetical protein
MGDGKGKVSMMGSHRFGLFVTMIVVLMRPSAPLSGADVPEPNIDGYTKDVAPFFKQHCLKCHRGDKAKANLALDKLNYDLTSGKDLGQWRQILDRVQRGEMPPEDQPRPETEAVVKASTWIKTELRKADPKLLAHESPAGHNLPHDGNRVPHDALFGTPAKPGNASPARIWRLSPQAYTELSNSIAGKGQRSLSQPFSGLTENGIKDYASAFTIDEPTTMQLYRNAKEMVLKQAPPPGTKTLGAKPVKEFVALYEGSPTRSTIETALRKQFDLALKRPPTTEELERFTVLMEKNIKDSGADGVRATLAAVLIHPEVVFRQELGSGPADEFGRQMLSPRELAFAISYALTDKAPDKPLLDAVAAGKLSTREDAVKHVERLLNDSAVDKPRILRFFQEYFGYRLALDVFKDKKSNPDHDPRALVADTDKLIAHILAQDKNVLVELLTTNKSFVPEPAKGGKSKPYSSYNLDQPPTTQPVSLPEDQRLGILTQPSWLIAYSTNFDNHAILRGKWIRERLLGGTVPDLPITVDAKLPDDPKQTLRERMIVTKEQYCWQCHQRMNNLGLPFEMFDHFGRHRKEELSKAVDATGVIDKSGDAKLDGEVKNALEMIRKLAASERVEQVFVRHAFRYWMGRNETPEDAFTLQEAHKAYRKSGGSMKALIAALLTSEAFLYRWAKPIP